MIEIFEKFKKDTSGLQILEFALLAPLLISMVLGTVELGRYIILNQKVSKSVFAMGDLVSRKGGLTSFDVGVSFELARKTLSPFDVGTNQFASRTTLRISGYNRPDAASGLIPQWTCFSGANITTTPPPINADPREGVMLIEMVYTYKTLFVPTSVTNFFSSEDQPIYRAITVRPRSQSLVPSFASMQTREADSSGVGAPTCAPL
jgi:hypothetical protein